MGLAKCPILLAFTWTVLERILDVWVCAQSHLSLCDHMDRTSPGISVPGISQARILEQVAISSSRESSQPRDWTCISCASCTAILYCWATWVALKFQILLIRRIHFLLLNVNNLHNIFICIPFSFTIFFHFFTSAFWDHISINYLYPSPCDLLSENSD